MKKLIITLLFTLSSLAIAESSFSPETIQSALADITNDESYALLQEHAATVIGEDAEMFINLLKEQKKELLVQKDQLWFDMIKPFVAIPVTNLSAAVIISLVTAYYRKKHAYTDVPSTANLKFNAASNRVATQYLKLIRLRSDVIKNSKAINITWNISLIIAGLFGVEFVRRYMYYVAMQKNLERIDALLEKLQAKEEVRL